MVDTGDMVRCDETAGEPEKAPVSLLMERGLGWMSGHGSCRLYVQSLCKNLVAGVIKISVLLRSFVSFIANN